MNEIEKNKTPISKKVSIIVCFALAWLMVIPLVRTAEKSVLHIVSLFVCNLFLALGINLWFFLKNEAGLLCFCCFSTIFWSLSR